MRGERRMEAENYLSVGYGLREAIAKRHAECKSLSSLTRISQPSRTKATLVAPGEGAPFLIANQMFAARPLVRKWLAVEKLDDADSLFAAEGAILVRRSADVGRTTLTYSYHERHLISDHFLRVEPQDPKWRGWLYAFFRSQTGRAILGSAQYGHIIKHLEIGHLNQVLVPILPRDVLGSFEDKTDTLLKLRKEAHDLTERAERLFSDYFSPFEAKSEEAFSVKASDFLGRRRRLEASYHVPVVRRIASIYKKRTTRVVPLHTLAKRIFVPGRFKHVYGPEGVPYVDSSDILETNPSVSKYVLSLSEEEQQEYHVEPGWVLMPCSGQVYGNLGQAVLSTSRHERRVISNHVLRVAPNEQVAPGYLLCAIAHPLFGRPQVVRLAFGSSVPEIAAEDMAQVLVPRIDEGAEAAIADDMRRASEARDEAEALDEKMATQADEILQSFLAGRAVPLAIC